MMHGKSTSFIQIVEIRFSTKVLKKINNLETGNNNMNIENDFLSVFLHY